MLGDTLILGIDEASEEEGLISTEMNDRFLKIKAKKLKWEFSGCRFFLMFSQGL